MLCILVPTFGIFVTFWMSELSIYFFQSSSLYGNTWPGIIDGWIFLRDYFIITVPRNVLSLLLVPPSSVHDQENKVALKERPVIKTYRKPQPGYTFYRYVRCLPLKVASQISSFHSHWIYFVSIVLSGIKNIKFIRPGFLGYF